MLSKERYTRAKVLFNAVRDKEEHSKYLFENKDLFPNQALHILNLIDRENGPISLTRDGLFAGYIDILAQRRRTHPLFVDYKQEMDNHLMFLYLKQRSREMFHAILVLKLFIHKCIPRFIEWFYSPDVGPFMNKKSHTWRLNNE